MTDAVQGTAQLFSVRHQTTGGRRLAARACTPAQTVTLHRLQRMQPAACLISVRRVWTRE